MVVGRFPSGRATSCQSFAIVVAVVAIVGFSKAKQFTRVAFAHLTRARVSLRTPGVCICVSGEATNKRREKKLFMKIRLIIALFLSTKERGGRGQDKRRFDAGNGPAQPKVG